MPKAIVSSSPANGGRSCSKSRWSRKLGRSGGSGRSSGSGRSGGWVGQLGGVVVRGVRLQADLQAQVFEDHSLVRPRAAFSDDELACERTWMQRRIWFTSC